MHQSKKSTNNIKIIKDNSTEEEFAIGPDGKRDYLKQDPPLVGQSWVCLSFVSPEDMIVKKELIYMNEFLVRDINQTLKAEATHMAKELSRVFSEQVEPIIDRYKASVNESEREIGKHLEQIYKKCLLDETNFANRCLHLYAIDGEEIHDKYKIFKTQAGDEIEKKFDKENNYRTSVRGLKIRGVYDDRRDADDRAKLMRQHEPLSVFVAPVGRWLPWDPDPDAIQDSDYMLPQLNELMKKYHDNVRDKNQHFEERKREAIENANLTNAEKKRKQMLKKLADRKKAQVDRELKERQLELLKEKKVESAKTHVTTISRNFESVEDIEDVNSVEEDIVGVEKRENVEKLEGENVERIESIET